MTAPTLEVIEAGIDWLTVTAADIRNANKMEIRALRIMREERLAGNEERAWSMSGFVGRMCGGVQFGLRHNEVLVRLTGSTADAHWSKFARICDNCSRIDLQVTVRHTQDAPKVIAKHYKDARKHSSKSERGPSVSIFVSNNDSSTLYLGSRQSDVYIRIYDKGAESGLDHYSQSLRYEVELKNELAYAMLNRLRSQSSWRSMVVQYVQTWSTARGVGARWSTGDMELLCSPRTRSTADRRLGWLRANVRGTVKFLMDHGRGPDCLTALGLDHLVQAHLDSIDPKPPTKE